MQVRLGKVRKQLLGKRKRERDEKGMDWSKEVYLFILEIQLLGHFNILDTV